MAISLSDFNKIWASTSPLTPYSFSNSNYQEGWNFIGGTPPARQMWDSYMKFSDEKQKYIVDNFLPLSGGTMTGNLSANKSEFWLTNITTNDAGIIKLRTNNTSWKNGATFELHAMNSSGAGKFLLQTGDGTNTPSLEGNPNGTLTWGGQPIQTSSDKRLKQDFADVPADVLDAWSKVEWKQFKYKADAQKKCDSCRWHTGLVAQDVAEISEDLLRYGILCHDFREADENNDAVDLWTIRYEEALAMEVIYLRKEIAKLKEEIESLKK